MIKALVIDDSLVARSQIKKVINSLYSEVKIDEGKCVSDGISLLETNQYDLITVDYNMPGGTGDAVIKQAKAKCPNSKIALLTANKQAAMKDKCNEWGVTLLEKPHFQDALKKLIAE